MKQNWHVIKSLEDEDDCELKVTTVELLVTDKALVAIPSDVGLLLSSEVLVDGMKVW